MGGVHLNLGSIFWLLLAGIPVIQGKGRGGVVSMVEVGKEPVIGQELANSYGIFGGFETGNVIRIADGTYHMIYGERAPNTTYAYKMGWTTQLGHWVSKDGENWSRLETVSNKTSLWSSVPVFDDINDVWVIFYVNEERGSGRPLLFRSKNRGYDAINYPNTWEEVKDMPLAETAYSISNPFWFNNSYHTFVDIGGFAVGLARCQSKNNSKIGFYKRISSSRNDTPLIDPEAVRHFKNKTGTFLENPLVTPIPGGFAATFDYSGGYPDGYPIPFTGFSWSSDGRHWPKENGVVIEIGDKAKTWTDLVRTPTALIPMGNDTYSLYFAARDTRKVSPPYLNCSVPGGCFWGIGRMVLKVELPTHND